MFLINFLIDAIQPKSMWIMQQKLCYVEQF